MIRLNERELYRILTIGTEVRAAYPRLATLYEWTG